MTPAERRDIDKLVALGASATFVGDRFMTWQPTTTGWTRWGLLAGALAIVVIALIGARDEHPLATLLAALGMLAATVLAAQAGTRWPAWTGLALAAVTVLACLAAYRTPPPAGPPSAVLPRGLRTRTNSHPPSRA